MKDNEEPVNDLKSLLGELNTTANPKDAIFKTMGENIWKKETLDQMNRFSRNEIIDMIKNYIVILIYEKCWHEHKVKHEVIYLKTYPFYRVKTTTDFVPVTMEKFLSENMHNEILIKITNLYIGAEGKARDEVFGFIKQYAQSLEMQAQRPNMGTQI